MFRKIKEKWNTSDRGLLVIITLLDIITVGMLIFTVMHPRPAYVLILIVLMVYSYKLDKILRKAPPLSYGEYAELEMYLARKADTESEKKKIKYIIECLIMVAVLLYLTSFLNLFFPYHMTWEYKSDIKKLKEYSYEEYEHFPDKIPEGAENVQWCMMPGFMQGSAYEYLYFSADKDYIDDIVRKYSETMIYTADDNGDFPISFPGMGKISEGKEKYITVYVIYDNGDWNHNNIYGFFVNRKDNKICFFKE